MTDKSETIVKSVGEIIFVEVIMPAILELTQTRTLAEYMLISEDKLKTH